MLVFGGSNRKCQVLSLEGVGMAEAIMSASKKDR